MSAFDIALSNLERLNSENVELWDRILPIISYNIPEVYSHVKTVVLTFDGKRLSFILTESEQFGFSKIENMLLETEYGPRCTSIDQTPALQMLKTVLNPDLSFSRAVIKDREGVLMRLNTFLNSIQQHIDMSNKVSSIIAQNIDSCKLGKYEYTFVRKPGNLVSDFHWSWISTVHTMDSLESTLRFMNAHYALQSRMDMSDTEGDSQQTISSEEEEEGGGAITLGSEHPFQLSDILFDDDDYSI